MCACLSPGFFYPNSQASDFFFFWRKKFRHFSSLVKDSTQVHRTRLPPISPCFQHHSSAVLSNTDSPAPPLPLWGSTFFCVWLNCEPSLYFLHRCCSSVPFPTVLEGLWGRQGGCWTQEDSSHWQAGFFPRSITFGVCSVLLLLRFCYHLPVFPSFLPPVTIGQSLALTEGGWQFPKGHTDFMLGRLPHASCCPNLSLIFVAFS